jgi:hypothetical protein
MKGRSVMDINLGMILVAILVGMCITCFFSFIVYYFLNRHQRENFKNSQSKTTELILAKLGLDIASIDLDAEKVKVDVMQLVQQKEVKREQAMQNKDKAEQSRKKALDSQLPAEDAKGKVLAQKIKNAKAEADLQRALNSIPKPPRKGFLGWVEEKVKVFELKLHHWFVVILILLVFACLVFLYLKMWKWFAILPLGVFFLLRAHTIAKREEELGNKKFLGIIIQDLFTLSWRTVVYVAWFSMWYLNKSFLP